MRVGIVGAGLAGLMAGRALQAAGQEVLVLEKGRSPGGRLATRRIGEATFDHGAQFFTVRSERFAATVGGWQEAGFVREWCRGFGPQPDGYPRYVVRGGMSALADHLAEGLTVRAGTFVFALRPGHGRWDLAIDDGSHEGLDAVVLTCPLPQAFSLMITAGIEAPATLRQVEYDRTLALLVVLDRPGAVPAPGGVQHADGTFSFIADNEVKGISSVPAITLHANAEWSQAWWEQPRAAVHAELLRLATPWLGDATVIASQVTRWRFATPRTIWPDRCWIAQGGVGPLVLAGDSFGGPKVEGAALSGLAAAAALS
jgi:renalase